jgi:Family of unknown function (DUF6884)
VEPIGKSTQASRVGLVGCVKTKRAHPALAKDLYTSPLFRGRRAYVECTCDRWFILSAKHGLVDPEAFLTPYDQSLIQATTKERQTWASLVLAAIKERLGDLSSCTFEIHAGATYTNHGLIANLRESGAQVESPAAGLALGQQLAFYQRPPC